MRNLLQGVVIFLMIQGVRGAEIPHALDTQWTFRKGMEGELLAMVIALRTIFEQMGMNETVMEKMDIHRRCGRILRMGDAVQDAILESASQKKECSTRGKARED